MSAWDWDLLGNTVDLRLLARDAGDNRRFKTHLEGADNGEMAVKCQLFSTRRSKKARGTDAMRTNLGVPSGSG